MQINAINEIQRKNVSAFFQHIIYLCVYDTFLKEFQVSTYKVNDLSFLRF